MKKVYHFGKGFSFGVRSGTALHVKLAVWSFVTHTQKRRLTEPFKMFIDNWKLLSNLNWKQLVCLSLACWCWKRSIEKEDRCDDIPQRITGKQSGRQ